MFETAARRAVAGDQSATFEVAATMLPLSKSQTEFPTKEATKQATHNNNKNNNNKKQTTHIKHQTHNKQQKQRQQEQHRQQTSLTTRTTTTRATTRNIKESTTNDMLQNSKLSKTNFVNSGFHKFSEIQKHGFLTFRIAQNSKIANPVFPNSEILKN